MVNPPPWQTVLANICRLHRQLQETLLWLDECEYEKQIPSPGKTPLQLVAELLHEQELIVHEVQAYLKETEDEEPIPPFSAENFPQSCYQNLVSFQNQMNAASCANLPEPLSVQVRCQCQLLLEQTAITRSVLAEYWFSLSRWERAGLRAFVAEQYDALLDSVGGLPESSLCDKVIAGAWTAREVLAHVLTWEEYGWEILHQWPNPDPQSLQPWTFENMDQANQMLVRERKSLDLIDVLGDLYTYRRRTLQFIDSCPDEKLVSVGSYGGEEKGTLVAFLLHMAQHRNEHAQSIWTARETGELP